ncbi:MAG: hypothetical protein EZS28_036793, partial [Streblomastix strix]
IGQIDNGRIVSEDNQSDQLIESLIEEQIICNQEFGMRIEENNELPTTEHTIEIPTFYNERFKQGTENMEQRRLCMPDGRQSALIHVAVTGELEKYLAFTHRGILYTQVAMRFGISITPMAFSKTIQTSIDRVRNRRSILAEKKIRKYRGGVSQLWMDDQ